MKMLMRADLKNAEQLDFVTSEIRRHRGEKKPYRSFYPIKRIKGTVKKVHRLGMNSYARFIYVNPIEGVLISYQSQSKFPHSPSYIIKLNEIKECGILLESAQARWFFKRNHYYFIVRSDSKTSYFFHENLDLVNYWVSVIHEAKEFYEWFQKLTGMRYDNEIQSANPGFIDKYDFIIDSIIEVNLPEVDLDQYSPQMQIATATYATNRAKSFMETTEQDMPIPGGIQAGHSEESKVASAFSTSDGQNLSSRTPEDKNQ